MATPRSWTVQYPDISGQRRCIQVELRRTYLGE